MSETNESKEKKNDLTGLLDYSKELQEMGVELHPSAQGDGAAILSESPIHKIDDFESLDDYAKTNPLAEEPLEPPLQMDEQPPIPEALEENPEAPQLEPPTESVTTEPTTEPVMQPLNDSQTDFPQSDFPTDFQDTPPSENFSSAAEILPPPLPEISSDFAVEPEMNLLPPVAVSPPALPPEMPLPPLVNPLENARQLSESITPGQPSVAAQYPFSLRIHGFLNGYEKEKLLDLLSKENFGFRELDLEPQFEAGKILLPRISEYAGILVIQALRGANVEFQFGPSDEGVTSSESQDTTPAPAPASQSQTFHLEELGLPLITQPLSHSADSRFQVIETVSVSSILETHDVDIENTNAYLETVQALKSELQYKARRKGASALFGFSLELTPLTTPHPPQYRLTASGVAVKPL